MNAAFAKLEALCQRQAQREAWLAEESARAPEQQEPQMSSDVGESTDCAEAEAPCAVKEETPDCGEPLVEACLVAGGCDAHKFFSRTSKNRIVRLS